MSVTHLTSPAPSTTDPAPVVPASASTLADRAERARARRNVLIVTAFAVALALTAVAALGVGRLAVPFGTAAAVIVDQLAGLVGLDTSLAAEATAAEASAVWLIRAPRVVLAIVVGAALAVSGAVLQSLFRNPLVSPDVIGVSSAASFGGVLTILLGVGGVWLVSGAFVAGLVAALLVLALGRLRTGSPILTIVLGGIVISALFNALVSLVTYLADPYTTLPSITFWLMGSFASTTWSHAATAVLPILPCLLVVFALRWRVNLLSLGDDEARSLGVRPERLRMLLIVTVSLLTAATVAVAGVIGWVGLVIPHLVRLVLGSDNRVLLPASALLGGLYLLLMDTLARSVVEVEIPVGILTAIIGAPVFVFLLVGKAKGGISRA
ncbi:ABC transporter transmembrane protein [Corynebacterium maris DSM 45190]|uniref:ABC transporter transmembrane protein n=1 Tax=Corynebacterium maris DSM 45190 TaxID=1224163 RepID=S5TFZ6_9CORY|nr:iron ABC transporter permease [Corynebacterium maris]AGS33583.1 ABC transporter transmembrane protein [Corynebacterium maris DSM 45190]